MTVGLTGGIGSGKSIISNLFKLLGCIIYNADLSAKTLYFKPDLKQKVIALLGKQAYHLDNTIDKQFIAEKIFNDNDLLQNLNAIMHPAVKTDFLDFESKHNSKLIIKETALLFELELNKTIDVTILVTAPIELKIERLKQRDGLLKQEILKRMQTQWQDDRKQLLANYIIINDDIQPLIPQVLSIYNELNGTLKI